MNFKRQAAALLLCGLLLAGILSGCGAAAAPSEARPLSVITTIFPAYDWVRQILGENPGGIELTLLLDNGVDLHSYQPTAQDMVKISTCDMFIYVGGESDQWVADALSEAVNRDLTAVNLLETLGSGAKEEEIVEGMQGEDDETDEAAPEYDEHVWLSLRNAKVFCAAIAERLGALDPAHRDAYAANAAAYLEKLDALDLAYQAAVRDAPVNTLLFGDRFPFRYLVDDYGLDYYTAFSGCSAETEASFETVIFLAEKLDELGLNAVLIIETGDGKIARTIIDSTSSKSARVLRMDSLQSTTGRDAAGGATYLGAMEQNLDILRQALQA